MPRIVISINKEGKTEIHVEEAQGAECVKLTENLEKKLGDVVDRRLTTEYYNQPERPNTILQKRRRK